MGFIWMIRLTPQPVSSFELGDHEFRIILKLMPDKGMVREQLPSYVRDPLGSLKASQDCSMIEFLSKTLSLQTSGGQLCEKHWILFTCSRLTGK